MAYQSAFRTLHIVLTGVFLLAGVSAASTSASSSDAPVHGLTHFTDELARLDRQIKAKIEVAARQPESWLRLEQLAKAYMERAQLTGQFRDYVTAENVLNKAFSLAGERAGPVLTRARLNFATHSLPAVEADLLMAESALLVDKPTTLSIQAIRADVFLYTGKYSEAKRIFSELEVSRPGVNSATRMASYYTQVGEYSEAQIWYEKAEQRVTGSSPHLRSWLKLQLGILDLSRGRLNDALGHYEEGLMLFPGYWLLEEHVAEINTLLGRDQLAEASYRDLIERTDSPLFMSALADILDARNDEADRLEATNWRAKIDRVYQARMDVIPELISGHALEYFLQAKDASQALELADYNFQLRPGGEARVLKAQAHMALGELSVASRLLDSVLESPYRSAKLFATAGVLSRISGDEMSADHYDSLALAINPSAVDDLDWLQSKTRSALSAKTRMQ